MIVRIAPLLLLLWQASAFTVAPQRIARQPTTLFSTEADQETVPIILNGQNIELTPALEDYVNKRVGGIINKLGKSGSVKECDVVLSVNKNPKVEEAHRVELVTNLKGTTIVCKHQSADMYTSIDAAASALNRKLLKYKERRTAGWHGGTKTGEDLMAALEELEELEAELEDGEVFEDPEKPEVMKVNSFQLDKPITLDEAIFALDYVDHDFYVFTNEATGKINVVYKRHGGGVGLVEP